MRAGFFPPCPKSSHISQWNRLTNTKQRHSEIWLQQQLKCIKKWLLQYNFINEWSTLVPAVSMWLGLHQATMGVSLLLLFDFQECVICYISPCQYASCKSILFFFLPNFWSISWIPTHIPAEILFLMNSGLGLYAWCCIPTFLNINSSKHLLSLSVNFWKCSCLVMLKIDYFHFYVFILTFYYSGIMCYRGGQACRLKWGSSRLFPSLDHMV